MGIKNPNANKPTDVRSKRGENSKVLARPKYIFIQLLDWKDWIGHTI